MAINKKEFAKELQTVNESTGISLNNKETEQLVDNVLETIIELSKQDKLDFRGFGSFEVKESAARKGINPKLLSELKAQGLSDEEAKAQAQVDIAAKNAPKFKPAKGYKDAVNQ